MYSVGIQHSEKVRVGSRRPGGRGYFVCVVDTGGAHAAWRRIVYLGGYVWYSLTPGVPNTTC